MSRLVSLVAALCKLLVPGTLAFLAASLLGSALVPLLLFGRRGWRWSAVLLGGVAVSYLMLSLPVTAVLLARSLDRYPPIAAAGDSLRGTALVVFDGDHQSGRLREAVRLYRLLQPSHVIAMSLYPEMVSELVGAGVPAEAIVWAHRSRTTREQALDVARVLDERGIGPIVLVASPIHMPRALATCVAVGIRASPGVALMPHPSLPRGARGLIPQREALSFSSESVYEYLALAYYGMRGWT